MHLIPIPKQFLPVEGKFYAGTPDFSRWQKEAELVTNPLLKKEEYRISITETGIRVESATEEGKFRAFSSLKQIAEQGKQELIPCCEIIDCPDIPNRGYMLDISRGKIPNLDTLKKLVDILADLKYNQLQLYMDKFVFAYDNFKEYCKDTQPLTKAEIHKLDEYCKERFIKLVPNVNSFGHMVAWIAKDEIRPLAICREDGKPSSTLNPLDERTFALIEKIYDDLFSSFSSDEVHIGMDEPFDLGFGQTKEACEKYGVGAVYTDYLLRVLNLVKNKYGKKPMFWDDIIFKHEEQLCRLPKDVIVMEWGYESEHPYDRHCAAIAQNNIDFYVCPGTSMWGSYTGRSWNMLENIMSSVRSAVEYGGKGFLLTEWGDGGNVQFPAITYLPLAIGGAYSWNAGERNSEMNKIARTGLLRDCEYFVNHMIFQTQAPLAEICFDLGKYYCLEDHITFNNSQLSWGRAIKEEIDAPSARDFRKVLRYLSDLYEELEEINEDSVWFREIKENAHIVLLFAREAMGEVIPHDEVDAVKAEFLALWTMKNHTDGSEIFLKKLESLKK